MGGNWEERCGGRERAFGNRSRYGEEKHGCASREVSAWEWSERPLCKSRGVNLRRLHGGQERVLACGQYKDTVNDLGIAFDTAAPYSSFLNAAVEASFRSVFTIGTRACLSSAMLHSRFWFLCSHYRVHAANLQTRGPDPHHKQTVPEAAFLGKSSVSAGLSCACNARWSADVGAAAVPSSCEAATSAAGF